MKRPVIKLPAIGFGAVLAALIFGASASAATNGCGWILEQNSPNTGACTIYVTPTAVKIVSTQYGFKMVCKAPDWKVHAFRDQEKISWEADLTKFDGGMMVRPLSGAEIKDDNFPAVGTEVKNGLRCRKFVNKPFDTDRTWAAEDVHISPQGADFLRRFYSSPVTARVPIFRTRFSTGGKKPKKNAWMTDYQYTDGSGWRTFLDTLSARRANLSAKDFLVPTGFKHETFLTQITFSKNKMGDLTDALDSLGFREDRKKP